MVRPALTAAGQRPLQGSWVPISAFPRGGVLAAFEQLDRGARHNGRDRVLVYKLRMTVAPEQKAEIVEPCNTSLQLYPVDQKARQRRLGFTYVVQEGILRI